ncbi:MAG: hypothetical protein AB7O38_07935 [Pirellulaceae bacterium]
MVAGIFEGAAAYPAEGVKPVGAGLAATVAEPGGAVDPDAWPLLASGQAAPDTGAAGGTATGGAGGCAGMLPGWGNAVATGKAGATDAPGPGTT